MRSNFQIVGVLSVFGLVFEGLGLTKVAFSNDQKSATLDIGGGLTEAQKKIIADKQIDYAPFSVRDHRVQYFEQAVGDMRQQISKGLWKNYKLDVRPGIENAGAFYCDLMKGGNKGKAIVQIRDPRA